VKAPTPIHDELQLFLDDWLVERMDGLRLELHEPERKEIVLVRDRPYETPTLYDPVVIEDDGRYRMWYRTHLDEPPFYTAYAESPDGIHWVKPELGLIEFGGDRANNLVWPVPGENAFGLCLFKDGNAAAAVAGEYKGTGIERDPATGQLNRLVGLVSPDGLRWRKLQEAPIVRATRADADFDSLNVSFWDAARRQYVAYLRSNRGGVRRIRRVLSTDFVHWSSLEELDLGDAPAEHLYKNAATPYYRRPDIVLMFPKRFLPERRLDPHWPEPGLSDIVFMHSRDGLRFHRHFLTAFVRPGRDPGNWHDRAIEIGPGVVPTGGGELSLYMVENYRAPTVRIRRLALREDGFVSARAGYGGGELVTRPLDLCGRAAGGHLPPGPGDLVLNHATSAAGSIRVEVQDEAGNPLPGLALTQCEEIYGDELERVVSWQQGPSLAELACRTVRLRFALRDADLYSFRFRFPPSPAAGSGQR